MGFKVGVKANLKESKAPKSKISLPALWFLGRGGFVLVPAMQCGDGYADAHWHPVGAPILRINPVNLRLSASYWFSNLARHAGEFHLKAHLHQGLGVLITAGHFVIEHLAQCFSL